MLFRQFRADAIRGQLVVSPAQNFLVFRAEQNIRNVTRAEFFVGAFDAGEELLGVDGDVGERSRGGGAVVAVGAIVGFV